MCPFAFCSPSPRIRYKLHFFAAPSHIAIAISLQSLALKGSLVNCRRAGEFLSAVFVQPLAAFAEWSYSKALVYYAVFLYAIFPKSVPAVSPWARVARKVRDLGQVNIVSPKWAKLLKFPGRLSFASISGATAPAAITIRSVSQIIAYNTRRKEVCYLSLNESFKSFPL